MQVSSGPMHSEVSLWCFSHSMHLPTHSGHNTSLLGVACPPCMTCCLAATIVAHWRACDRVARTTDLVPFGTEATGGRRVLIPVARCASLRMQMMSLVESQRVQSRGASTLGHERYGMNPKPFDATYIVYIPLISRELLWE